MTREAVLAALGPPDGVGAPGLEDPRPQVWLYGSVELHWEESTEHLRMIFLDHFECPTGGKRLALDPWVVRGASRARW